MLPMSIADEGGGRGQSRSRQAEELAERQRRQNVIRMGALLCLFFTLYVSVSAPLCLSPSFSLCLFRVSLSVCFVFLSLSVSCFSLCLFRVSLSLSLSLSLSHTHTH